MIGLWALLLLSADPLSDANRAREAGRTDEAIALYTRALQLQPTATEGWWYLGLCLYEKDRYAEASAAFRHVVEAQPKQGAGWAMLGVAQRGAKDYDRAFESLRRAHALGIPAVNDLDKVARLHYTALLNRAGQFEVSSGLLMTFVASSSVTPAVKQLAGIAALRMRVLPEEVPPAQAEPVRLAGEASVLAWQKKNAEARDAAAALIAKYPRLANAQYLMGYVLLLNNDPACLDAFRRVIEMDPGHVQARLQIAYEHFKRGEMDKALPSASEAVNLAPNDFIARDIHGRVLLALERLSDAVGELEAAVKLAPDIPEPHFHLASAYARLGRKSDAAKQREIFAKLDKERQR